MVFLRRNLCLGLFGAILALAGCATSDFSAGHILRPAANAPDRFLVGSPGSPELSEPAPGTGCRSPLVDPRDGTRLTLMRSGDGQGDYAVPAGAYQVGPGELLRIDCATGRALGVVRR